MKNPPEPAPEGGGGGTLESKLTWALNIAAFVHIFVSPYTKVGLLLYPSRVLLWICEVNMNLNLA